LRFALVLRVACVGAVIAVASPLAACPFCTVVGPTLSQRRDQADVVALGELLETGERGRVYRLHRALKGEDLLSAADTVALEPESGVKPGTLALLFAEKTTDPPGLSWTALAASEVAVGYFFAAPDLRRPAADRLRYFARHLEHADPLVAEDAFGEFGRASLDEVSAVADAFDSERLRAWLADPAVPQHRQGFYGLALGLATGPGERQANLEFLRRRVARADTDFRAGFDGQLGGYLLLDGEAALADLEQRFLANPQAAVGDVRHAMSALRSYQQYGREIPVPRLAAALRRVLARAEFAEQAIADLARWEDWDALDQVAGLWDRSGYEAPEIRRAIVGYLCVCPLDEARDARERIRREAPALVAQVEQRLSLESEAQ
jgi:hypothetical protein